MKAIDTYWICTAEHGLNASTFTARVTASTGADCGASLSSAVGALSGPLHGGAPAYVKPMLEEVRRRDGRRGEVGARRARERQADMGWPPRLPRRGLALARAEAHPRRSSARRTSRSPRSSRRSRFASCRSGTPSACSRRTSSTTRPSSSTSPRSRRPSRPRCSPARASPGGRSAHILEQLDRSPLPGRRRATSGWRRGRCSPLDLAEAPQAEELAEWWATRRRSRHCGSSGTTSSRWRRATPDFRVRAQAYRAIAQFRFRQKTELLRRGLEDDSPACRGSALVALESLSRDHPRSSTRCAEGTRSRARTATRRCGGSRSSA